MFLIRKEAYLSELKSCISIYTGRITIFQPQFSYRPQMQQFNLSWVFLSSQTNQKQLVVFFIWSHTVKAPLVSRTQVVLLLLMIIPAEMMPSSCSKLISLKKLSMTRKATCHQNTKHIEPTWYGIIAFKFSEYLQFINIWNTFMHWCRREFFSLHYYHNNFVSFSLPIHIWIFYFSV